MNCLHVACVLAFCFRCVHTQVTCSFEDGPCGWHNVSDDPQQGWGIWHMGKLAFKRPHDNNIFSGPYDDHTHQNKNITNDLQGSYLYYTYTTSTLMRCLDSLTEMQLESSLLNLTTAANLSFWYVLKGQAVGHLRLFGKNEVLLWDSSVNHTGSEEWTQATVQLEPAVYRLTFKASCKYSRYNDIAIDDIVLEGEPLNTMTTTQYDETTALPLETSTGAEFSQTKNPTTRTKTLPLSLETTTTVESGNVHTQVSCSFEDGPCGWHNVSDDPQQGWGIWHMGKLNNALPHDRTGFSGPRDDHTHNNLRGSYLYYTYTTDPPMRCVDSQTEIQLESSLLDLRTAVNLTFWYVLKGRMIGHLRLFGRNEVLLWDSSVNHTGSEDWTQAIVQLESGVSRLTFKASCKYTTKNDIAIDDIVLEGEPLDTMTTTQSDGTTALPLETSTDAELGRTKRPTTRTTALPLKTSTQAELSKSQKPTTRTTALPLETSTQAELSKSQKPTTRTTALPLETSTQAELSKSQKPTTTTALSLETSTQAELSKSQTPTTRTTALSSEASTAGELSKSQKPTTRKTAMSLWYMLKGRFAGQLDLFGKNGVLPWDSSVSHSSSQEWMQASVQQESGVNGLTLKASYKYALYNDIAINGILLKKKPLDTMTTTQSVRTSVLPLKTSGGSELRRTKRPTIRTTALSSETSTAAELSKSQKPTTPTTTCCLHTQVSCSFEDGPCGWHNVSDDPQQGWGIWHMGKLAVKLPHGSNRFSGPYDDHTLQNLQGSYLYYTYTTSTPMRCLDSQTEIQLESSLLNLRTVTNLSFWYVLRGAAVGHLHLFGKNRLKLWDSFVNHTGSQDWRQASVQLESGVYRLTFRASCKYTFHNDIAIDDIVLEGEPLGKITTTQSDGTAALPSETSRAAKVSNKKKTTET